MKERFRLKGFGRKISLAQIVLYLKSSGWTIHVDQRPIRCEGPLDDEGQPIVALIPSDETLRDYPLRLEDLIVLLSELEERPAIRVANDLATVQVQVQSTRKAFIDILRKHVPGGQSEKMAEQYSRTLDVLAENVELMIGGSKTIALVALLDACAKMQGVFEEPRLLLWRLIEWAGVNLKAPTPAKLDALYELAVTSHAEMEVLFDWLSENRSEDSPTTEKTHQLGDFRQSIN